MVLQSAVEIGSGDEVSELSIKFTIMQTWKPVPEL